jgi:D-amino-acid dehydrogenase
MTDSSDVIILGGGVIGLACAHYLLQAGRQVRVIEQGKVGCGSSHGNCGTLTPSHATPLAAPGMIGEALRWMFKPDAPFYVRPRWDPALARWLLAFSRRCNFDDWRRTGEAKARVLRRSRALIEALVREQQLDCEFSASGLLYVFRSHQAMAKASEEVPMLARLGVRAETWDGRRLASEEPALLPGMAGALHFPGDARLRPDRYVAELARIVRAQGGVIEERCRVVGFEREGDRVSAVHTERGPRRARDIVFALGAWSPTVGRQLGLRLPIQPGKGYSITYTRPEQAPNRPLVLKERSVCVTTWRDGFRLGSTMEFSGYNSCLNPTRLRALVRGAREYLQTPEGPEHVEDWYGWRPMTIDDLPLIGTAPGMRNLMLATGHGMMGVGMSAVTGHLVADLLCQREPIIDPALCAPGRSI